MLPTGDCRVSRLAILLAAIVAISGGFVAAAAGADAHRDLVRVGLKPADEDLWLRINAGGHTAAVEALAFTPDSTRLCSAGLDKVVQVWNLGAVTRDIRRVFLRERTIRWQVARGLRGSIYALASAPDDGLLALAGYGAMGSLGEILLVNPLDGSLSQVLEGHRQTVCSLAFSADGQWLASADVSGAAILWQRGPWQPVVLRHSDDKTYGAQQAALIGRQPKLRPIAIAGASRVILPGFAGADASGRLRWKLVDINLANTKDFRTLETVHYGMVSALAASADGSRLASADLEGNLYLWDFARGRAVPLALRARKSRPAERDQYAPVISLWFSPDGRTLAAGTLVAPGTAESRLQVWDLPSRRVVYSRKLPDHVRACAISPDGKRLAYTGGKENEVFVAPLDAPEKSIALAGTGKRILKVAFAKEKPFYRIAFGTDYRDRGFNDYADLQASFDPTRSSLSRDTSLQAPDWLPADWSQGGWRARLLGDGSLQLAENGVPKGKVVLDARLEGRPRCYCWIPDAQDKPFAIAVGTDVQNSVYVFRLAEKGSCPILRHFRGHHDYVTSLAVSRDARLLASSSADGTIMVWSLSEYQKGAEVLGRWGAEFALGDQGLVVKHLDPAGPLLRKGLREGDVVTTIRWPAEGTQRTESQPAAMLRALQTVPWATQVVFEARRERAARPTFQLLPAWQPLATLFVATDGEWALWTPEGYYDASMNGYRLFGWQVNRGLHTLPDFYRADQFYQKLERPDVLNRLLPAGSLQEAFRQAAAAPPKTELHEVLPDQIAATPQVTILEPSAGVLVREGSTIVKARVRIPADYKLVRAKVFANGVVATGQQEVGQRAIAGGSEVTYQWKVLLPKDERNLIQVIVGTDAPTAAFSDVVIQRSQPAPAPLPKLYLVVLGINKYADPEIQPLSYSVADARAVAEELQAASRGVYTLAGAVVLTDKAVTPQNWRATVEQLRAHLKDSAKPDDLIVFFLAGHGVVDEDTHKYYFVGHDFQLSDLQARVYSACLGWEDFRSLGDIPCRKLVMLDTCYSGAIQPPRASDLKNAVRQLQEDVIFTVTAATGEQRSAEKAAWKHGAFTKCLLDGLAGGAVVRGDPVVTLDEVVAYVKRSVPELTQGAQTPTAAPDEILPYTSLPLAHTK
jgi:WD40 repeat protein